MGPFLLLADREGFEPPNGYKPLMVFKTTAFNHSATSPNCISLFDPRIWLCGEVGMDSHTLWRVLTHKGR